MQNLSLADRAGVFCTIGNKARAHCLFISTSRVMIEELDKLPAADLFSRSEENVPGICSPNQPKYLDEKFVLPRRMQSCVAREI